MPEYSGSPQKLARRQDLWRSVITQQLQADELAVEMATQLFAIAPDPEAKLYYTTMVQDESRHTEGWLQLVAQSGGMGERDPYLDKLAHMTLEADTLEEKVFLMQVFYERLIIPRFRLIARSSRGTVLEDLCNRLAIDDGIHHGAGMAYERVLLATAGDRTKNLLIEAANRMLPLFVQHALWRPKAREFVGQLMHDTDVRRLHEDVENGVRLARSLGPRRLGHPAARVDTRFGRVLRRGLDSPDPRHRGSRRLARRPRPDRRPTAPSSRRSSRHPTSRRRRASSILPDVRGLYRFYEELALRFAERGHAALAIDYFGRTAGVAKRGRRLRLHAARRADDGRPASRPTSPQPSRRLRAEGADVGLHRRLLLRRAQLVARGRLGPRPRRCDRLLRPSGRRAATAPPGRSTGPPR